MYFEKSKDIFYPLLTKRSQSHNFEVARLKSVKVRRLHGNTSFYAFILKKWHFAISLPCSSHSQIDLKIKLF